MNGKNLLKGWLLGEIAKEEKLQKQEPLLKNQEWVIGCTYKQPLGGSKHQRYPCLSGWGRGINCRGLSRQVRNCCPHNSYTGPMKLRKQMAPVKQYKIIVGKLDLKSAPFLSPGRNIITHGALAEAL